MQSKYFSPGALQHRNKAVTFTAVPLFVRGRQEICPGGRFSFCLRRRGATNTWPNCNNAGYRGNGCTFIQRYVPLSRDDCRFPLSRLPFHSRGACPREDLRTESYFGYRFGFLFSPFLTRSFDKSPARSVKNYCDFYRP